MRKINSLFLALGLSCVLAVALVVEVLAAPKSPSTTTPKSELQSYDSGSPPPAGSEKQQTAPGGSNPPKESRPSPKNYIRTK